MSGETLRAMAAQLSSKSPEEVAALADQAAAAQRMAPAPPSATAACVSGGRRGCKQAVGIASSAGGLVVTAEQVACLITP